jgi:drug/metabolite transporter (DMT)-like permease
VARRTGEGLKVAQFVLICFIWGSTWLVIKVGYGGLGPFNVAAIRFFLAGIVLAAVMPIAGVRWPRGRAEWGIAVWVGLFLFTGDYGLIYWGEQRLTSGLTAILFATLPLATIFAAHAYLPGERLTGRTLGGTLVAVFGVVVLFGDSLHVDASSLVPMTAIIGAAACAAIANVATKRHGGALHPAALNAPAMLVGSVALAGASLAAGDGFRLPTSGAAWMAIGYLSLVGSVAAFLIYFSLMKTWSATSLSFVGVLMPLVALALGALVLHEPLTIATLGGAALILAGVTVAQRR